MTDHILSESVSSFHIFHRWTKWVREQEHVRTDIEKDNSGSMYYQWKQFRSCTVCGKQQSRFV